MSVDPIKQWGDPVTGRWMGDLEGVCVSSHAAACDYFFVLWCPGLSPCCRCSAVTVRWTRRSTGLGTRRLCADWACWTTTQRAAAPWWVAYCGWWNMRSLLATRMDRVISILQSECCRRLFRSPQTTVWFELYGRNCKLTFKNCTLFKRPAPTGLWARGWCRNVGRCCFIAEVRRVTSCALEWMNERPWVYLHHWAVQFQVSMFTSSEAHNVLVDEREILLRCPS